MKKLKNFSYASSLFTMIIVLYSTSSLCAQVDLVTNLTSVPAANSEDILQFDNILKHQMGVAVLGGETTKPIYFDHTGKNETIYKYDKFIDVTQIPIGLLDTWEDDHLVEKLSKTTLEALVNGLDLATAAVKEIFSLFGIGDGSKPDWVAVDCWYPVSKFRTTACGKVKADSEMCTQDKMHTKVTIDKDFTVQVVPSKHFSSILENRWFKDKKFEDVEGEVAAALVTGLPLRPVNRQLLSIKKDDNLCIHGAHMADNLDVQIAGIKVLDAVHPNNEIHPINQIWRRQDEKIVLTSIVDNSPYFHKKDKNQAEASGLNQKMSFYKAFHLSSDLLRKNIRLRYQIKGEGFKFDSFPSALTSEDDFLLKYNNDVLVEVREINNRFKTQSVKFDQVKRRPDGSIQGYIVVETEKIRLPGGSINVTLSTKPLARLSQIKSNGNGFDKMNLGDIGQFDASQIWKSGDFNGDGKSDLLALIGNAQGSSRYTIYFSTMDSLRFDSKSGGLIINHNDGEWLVGDCNGDGKDDLINVYKNSANRAVVTTMLSDGARFGDVADTQALDKYYTSQIWATADINGDSKSDLVLVFPHHDNTTRVKVYLAGDNKYSVSGSNIISVNHNLRSTQTKVLVSDFNGDGKADLSLVYGGNGKTKAFLVYAGENSYIGQTVQRTELVGTGFDKLQHWRAGDANGDNKSDLICVMPATKGEAVTAVHYSSGQAFMPRSVSTILEGSSTLNRYIRGDFNGDGKTDLINVMEYLPE